MSSECPNTVNTPMLSCVIINYNTRDSTSRFLESLYASSAGIATEVIVIDNGSHDGSVAEFRARFPAATVVDTGENLGFARGVNVGVDHARGKYILLLNPDMVVLPGSLEAILHFAETHPGYGIYGGRTLKRDGSLEPSSCWGAPSLWSLFTFATLLSRIFSGSKFFDPESLGTWQRDTVREVDIITGCLLLMRRDLYLKVGGMDEDYFLYGEDAEFGLRLRALGWKSVIVPDAQMVHEVGGSTEDSGHRTAMVLAGKVTMFRKLWPPRRADLAVRLLWAGTGIRAGLEALLTRPGPWRTAWERRADWLIGYPGARTSLFGLPLERTGDQS